MIAISLWSKIYYKTFFASFNSTKESQNLSAGFKAQFLILEAKFASHGRKSNNRNVLTLF